MNAKFMAARSASPSAPASALALTMRDLSSFALDTDVNKATWTTDEA